MTEQTRVKLPADVSPSFEVFVNGVPQARGVDYQRRGDELLFNRSLAREGKLGFWRWLSIFLGVAGTYRQDDIVDVVFERGGAKVVESGLKLVREA